MVNYKLLIVGMLFVAFLSGCATRTPVVVTPNTNTYQFTSDFGAISALKYRNFIKANKGKKIYVYLRSRGGDVDSGMSMIAANVRHGNVHIRVRGLCASMCALFMHSGKTLSVDPFAKVMYHLTRITNVRPVRIVYLNDKIPAYRKVAKMWVSAHRRYAKKFLSKREWNAFIAGKDVWVTGRRFSK